MEKLKQSIKDHTPSHLRRQVLRQKKLDRYLLRLEAGRAVQSLEPKTDLEKLIEGKAYKLAEEILGEEATDAAEELHRAEREKQLDDITGMYLMGAFEEMYVLSTNRLEIKHKSVLIAIDIDRFKQVNHELGHDGGDELLRRVGKAIRKNTREGVDFPGRSGGDEFLVLFNGIPIEQDVVELANKITAAIGDINITDDSSPLTVSVGCYEVTVDQRPFFKKARQKADQAAKISKNGRNRLTVVHDGMTKTYVFDYQSKRYIFEKDGVTPKESAESEVDINNQRSLEEIRRWAGDNLESILAEYGAETFGKLTLDNLKLLLERARLETNL